MNISIHNSDDDLLYIYYLDTNIIFPVIDEYPVA